ncbi:MAG TPA: hypothetical protein VIG52_05145 [Methyloceanibacter sp.]|jgi:hypothetical protein
MSNRTNVPFAIAAQTKPEPPSLAPAQASVHPVVIELAIGAALWFIAIVWLAFASGETDFLLVVITLFFAFFFGLFLLTASYGLHDPRWELPSTTFREFLTSGVSTETGTMRGRDVLIEIMVLPLSLALAVTLIGIAWMAIR